MKLYTNDIQYFLTLLNNYGTYGLITITAFVNESRLKGTGRKLYSLWSILFLVYELSERDMLTHMLVIFHPKN